MEVYAMGDGKIAEPVWNDLKIFFAVVKARSLSGASKALNISHSTVCRRVARLEETVGVCLIRRTTNGIIFTHDGQQLGTFVERMGDNVNDIRFWLKKKQEHIEGTLTVSCCDIALPRLSSLIGAFSATNPNTNFEISATPMHVDLREASTDLAIRATNSPDEDLVGIRLHSFSLQLAQKREAQKIDSAIWVGLNDCFAHLPGERWQGEQKDACTYQLKADSYMCVGEIIRSGVGIGLLPSFIVENDDTLKSVPTLTPLPCWNLWLLYHPSLNRNPLLTAFASHLKNRW
ncbi:LysR family transcriptional regulator [Enterovibrio norvegicus]|nr:LysR family transcriptional regulator [Enterovibrio norvegicus]OEF56254.1 LysR family transcriptional regulator [Enterovibrio norvegicus]OEF60749.1 LysR family transcriptional regulator [Enterovibrio norvegicus]PMH60684.1 LysR family transcriptional regulator [Enterovibrio norvegicus]PMI31282.1 LysR family transcriptional regulator [Enterovibrio norvegicus]